MIIGLSGYARSGKDTVADILVKEAGFIRVAFADKLRETLYALNPTVTWDYKHGLKYNAKATSTVQSVIDEFGWDGVKSTGWGTAIRTLLQRMGTEVGRNILGENIWVDATFFDLDVTKNYVISDARFRNEAKAITTVGGEVWRVTRPGVEPANDHISEIGLDTWPFNRIIYNDGTLDDLKRKVLDSV